MLSKYEEIFLAIIYGSVMKDHSFRDIDVAVYVHGDLDFLYYKFKLDRELLERIGYPVDVKILNNAPSWFILEVFEKGEVLVINSFFLIERLYKKALDEEYLIKLSNKMQS